MDRNYYQILQVGPDAEPEAIEAAYRARVLNLKGKHDGISTEELKVVSWAYKTLIDSEKRAQYDMKRKNVVLDRLLEERRLKYEVASTPWWRSKWAIGSLVGLVVLLALMFVRR